MGKIKSCILYWKGKIEHDLAIREYRIGKKKREKWLNHIRKKNKNYNFTLVTNNCIGGVIYHDLGLQFQSPTINMTIFDFTDFVENFKLYMDAELVEIESYECCPMGMLISETLKPLKIRFDHYENFETAKEKWEARKKRINYHNLFFLAELYNGHEPYEFERFLSLDPAPNKAILYHEHFRDEKNRKDIHYIGCETGTKDNPIYAQIFEIKGNTGRRWLDDFDYVSFLNR